MSRKRLVINADGFGFTPGINRGITESVEKGVVSSTSCVVNFPYIEDIVVFKRNFPKISTGIHFNLSVGKPVSPPEKVKSLVDEEGEFWRENLTKRIMMKKIKFNDMLIELESQVKKLMEYGVKISHFSGYENKHLYPPFLIAAIKIARRYGITKMRSHNRYLFVRDTLCRKRSILNYYMNRPFRLFTHSMSKIITKFANFKGMKTADRLITSAYYLDHPKKYLLDTWLRIIETLPEGTSEMVCHPGYPDDLLRKYAKYADERRLELDILTSEEIKNAITDKGIEIISFHEL